MSSVEVVNKPHKSRYEALVDNRVAGFAEYRMDGEDMVFTHTEVDDAYEGQGVGSRLVRAALEDVRRQGRRIEAQCPFVSSYIDKHADYQDLLHSPSQS
ncbi:MAG TPA: GNAT family N-acetyltransferase [Actinomycetales bacterium]|nr:GNAT family N-acetyltransferase [Actinomycetales bacterium]